jgi:hypothetical protein
MAVVATPLYSRNNTHHSHAPSAGLQSTSSWGMASSSSGFSGAVSGMRSDLTLVTGHKDGSTLLWDISGDNARALLSVSPRGRHAVRCLGMAEQLGLLVVGHTNGKVRAGCRQGRLWVGVCRDTCTVTTSRVHPGVVHGWSGHSTSCCCECCSNVPEEPQQLLRPCPGS